jgi:DNA polymerase III alpha subunit (gram-positive type)
MSQEDYEPGDPRALPEEERERLIQKKMAELRKRTWENEIEQEARRRLAQEEQEEAMRLQAQEEQEEERHEQLVRELEERLEEDERREREANEKLLEKQRVTPETDPTTIFYQWTINGKNFYRNAKGHVFKFKEGLLHEDDWLGIWFPETGFMEVPFPADEYVIM